MVNTIDRNYKMAYTELYQILIRLVKDQKDKLPNNFIDEVHSKMDKEHSFIYNNNLDLENQNLMPETKALIVEIYERYLCPEEEKVMWKKYDQLCLNEIEENKAKQYNKDNLFKSNKEYIENENNKLISVENEKATLKKRLINLIKRIFNVKKK